MITPSVDILLATFNGGKYLNPLLKSISDQSYPNWRLIIRDDGSIDETLDIIYQYQKSHKEQICIASDSDRFLGVCKSFNRLMEQSNADYVMFCDQDDVWMKDKIDVTLDALLELENKYGQDTPLLVHSDLVVTDSRLNIISHSFWQYQHLASEPRSIFSNLLMHNVVTGNTVIINRSAKERAIPIPKEAIMHDWWVALVTAAFGKIKRISKTTVLYRQHGHNEIGAKQWGINYLVKALVTELATKGLRKSISRCERQAAQFFHRYNRELDPKQHAAAYAMAHLSELNPIARRHTIWRHRLYKSGIARNVGLFLII